MIIYPQNPQEEAAMMAFLSHFALVAPTADMKCIGWEEDGDLKMVVGLNAFIGAVCQIHVAMAKGFHFTPRALLTEVFDGAFNRFNVAKLIGIVNSLNVKAMRYDLHLGFKEEHRMVGMHDDGGDLVILSMSRTDCKYLNRKPLILVA